MNSLLITARIMTTLVGGDLAIKTITGTTQSVCDLMSYVGKIRGPKSSEIIA